MKYFYSSCIYEIQRGWIVDKLLCRRMTPSSLLDQTGAVMKTTIYTKFIDRNNNHNHHNKNSNHRKNSKQHPDDRSSLIGTTSSTTCLFFRLIVVFALYLLPFLLLDGTTVLAENAGVSDGTIHDEGTDDTTILPLDRSQLPNVTILGLGGMGVSVVRCLAVGSNQPKSSSSPGTTPTPPSMEDGRTNFHSVNNIHVWNRGDTKRQRVHDMNLTNTYIHTTIGTAIDSSDIVFTMIDDWDGTKKIIRDYVSRKSTATTTTTTTTTKTFVLFSTYSPNEILEFQNELNRDRAKGLLDDDGPPQRVRIVGGAIVAVPQTICTPQAFWFSSSSKSVSNDDKDADDDDDDTKTKLDDVLNGLGRHYSYYGYDIGIAPLLNIALIQGITFGIVGHEMSQLLLERYLTERIDDETTTTTTTISRRTILQQYNTEIVHHIVPTFIGMLLPFIGKQIPYVPAKTFLHVMKLHMKFSTEIGIHSDIYLAQYVYYLEKIDAQDKAGPAQWIKYATTGTTNISISSSDAISTGISTTTNDDTSVPSRTKKTSSDDVDSTNEL
jgi:hypothetical protein